MASELEVEIRDIRRWLRVSLALNVLLAAVIGLVQYWPAEGLWLLALVPLVLIAAGWLSVRARSRSRQRHRGPDLCVACLTPMAEDANTCSACGWTFDVA